MTINPARLLRLEARLGAVERGRDADLVLLTGDPLSLSSRVKMVLVDGKVVYEDK
jgi:imidazolonepropionase-like amidohydrolase